MPLVGVPKIGVTSVGDVANTAEPVPVSSVKAERRFALVGVARNVATPVPNPLTPVEIGNPVQLVSVPLVGVPKIGVTSVGEVAKTAAPVPVSSVSAERKFALDGVARNVATPVPKPLTPVEIGTFVIVLLAPLIVLFVSVAVPLIVGKPPVEFVAIASASDTPVPSPVILPTAGVMVDALAASTSPFAFTVKATDCVADPKLPTFELTVASVPAAVTGALPLKLTDQVRSPEILIARAVVRVAALPVVFWFSVGKLVRQIGRAHV